MLCRFCASTGSVELAESADFGQLGWSGMQPGWVHEPVAGENRETAARSRRSWLMLLLGGKTSQTAGGVRVARPVVAAAAATTAVAAEQAVALACCAAGRRTWSCAH